MPRSSRVYIGNLPRDVTERDIERFCDKYGRARNVFINNGRYAFCEFDDQRDAEDVVYYLNGRELHRQRVIVEHARSTGPRSEGFDRRYDQRRPGDKYGPPVRTSYRVSVTNLSSKCSWQELKSVFHRAGEVTFADAHSIVTGEGVVHFISRNDVEKAIDKFDDYELYGRHIRVRRDRSSRSRSRSRDGYSRSRSRSGSGSRSRSRSRSRSDSRGSARSARSRSRERNGSADGGDY